MIASARGAGPHVLEATGLRKLYRKKIAVGDVSFSMSTGEVVGLLGPNGAGKTTVFYMVVGFIRPTRGHGSGGRPGHKRPADVQAGEARHRLPAAGALDLQAAIGRGQYPRRIARRGPTSRKSRKRELLEELLEEFGIARLRRQKAYTLSGGERRRTEIARALALEPKFLLLDEPFAGIDPIAVHEIKSIVRRLSEAGIGVLITDHNVRDTLEITHRAHIINLGNIVVSGNRDEVLASEMARKIYLGEEFRM